ncbi:MAG: HAD-IC family P-type ATPase, partial [Chloroflexi bacterium]|nr:HAD-IC family P-type ATPase [Chloroflexota bacterium]
TDIVVLNGKSEDKLLALVASAESRSEHPLAEAILKAARKRSIPVIEPDAFEAVPGKGIKAEVGNDTIYVGSRRLMEFFKIEIPEDILQRQHELENEGKTVLLAHNGREWLGLFAVADTPRAEAIDLVRHLKSTGIKHIAMLTGDNQRVADTLGEQVGFTDVYAELLPEDKVNVVNSLKQYGRVAMVGDGVNDAPALATADIGIAMGAAGTDVALETADLVLMSSDLSRIPFAIGLSRKARRVMIQNIIFSLSVIIILTIAALLPMIDVPLPLGVVGHEGSTLIVVTNGLRLLRYHG